MGVGAERAESAPWEADPAATSAQARTFCACTLWGERRGDRWHGAGALAIIRRSWPRPSMRPSSMYDPATKMLRGEDWRGWGP